ncbi:MAG: LacI family DNA-binding transcriptional regulator [Verrucomicrobiota bacterium]
MTPAKRITLRDIAERAKLSSAAVSMALRNKPTLPPATINRVKRIAEELGYVPDPALSALSARREGNRPYDSVIAWVSNWDTVDAWQSCKASCDLMEGASKRASELGYELRHVWAREAGMSNKRLSDVLVARGIRGVILAPCQRQADPPLELDWDRFSLSSVLNERHYPGIHNVVQDQYSAVSLCWKELLKMGHSRVGMVVSSFLSDRWSNRWEAAQALYQSRYFRMNQQIPILRVDDRRDMDRIRFWIRRYRPTAIISRIPFMREAIEAEGLRIPEDIGFASLNILSDNEPNGNGILQACERLGSIAVDVLDGKLKSYQRGLMSYPQRTQIVGEWNQGETVREVASLPRAAIA